MPVQVDYIRLPISVDEREPLYIPESSGSRLQNMRSDQEHLVKGPGRIAADTILERFDLAPSNFFHGTYNDVLDFPDPENEEFMAVGPTLFHACSGASWGINIGNGAAGRAPIPNHIFGATARYSIVNTLGKVYIAAGGGISSEIIVRDPTEAVPADTLKNMPHDLDVNFFNTLVLLGFANRLIAIRTMEDTVEYLRRIRWCANGDPTKWNAALNDGAGFLDIVETSSRRLTGGFVLGERCFLTKSNEILELIPTGRNTPTFTVQQRIAGTGMLGYTCVDTMGQVAMLLSSDNVYLYDGSALTKVGDPIYKNLFLALNGSTEQDISDFEIHANYRDMEFWLHPSYNTEIVYVYDLKRDRWYKDKWPTNTIGSIQSITANTAWNFNDPLLMNGNPVNNDSLTPYFVTDRFPIRATGAGSNEPYEVIVQTKEILPRKSQGAVAMPDQSRMNTVWEIFFQVEEGVSDVVIVGISTNSGVAFTEQTITVPSSGLVRSFWTNAFNKILIRIRTNDTEGLTLRSPIGFRWSETGTVAGVVGVP